jgi:hypothetical protein
MEEHVRKFRDILTNIDTKVIVYLRRQDYWLMSAYQQQVKMYSVTSNINDWFTEEHKKERYWYKPVPLWAKLFGKENVIVRPYEVQQFVGGNIFSDFLDILGFALNDLFEVPPKRVNAAYRTDALEVIRLINFLPLATENRSHLYTLFQRYSEYLGKEEDWPYTLFSPAKRHQIAKLYDQENQTIAKEYLSRNDGQLFYEPLPDLNEPWKPYPGLSEESIRKIADFVLRNDIQTSIQIKRAVSMGLKSKEAAVKTASNRLLSGFIVFIDKRITLWDYFKYYLFRVFKKLRRSKMKTLITALVRRLSISH